jgi:cellulose 1,4-beta-cellobiosidase
MKNNNFFIAIFSFIILFLFSFVSHTQAAVCSYSVTNDWGSGFTALIKITNNGSAAINNWAVSWNYTDGSKRTDGWNANFAGNNPSTATPLSWNATIAAGASIEFGVKGTNGGSKAQVPVVTGTVCGSTPTPSSLAKSSVKSSIKSSVKSSIKSSVKRAP